jgi:uncharacterized membrane protein
LHDECSRELRQTEGTQAFRFLNSASLTQEVSFINCLSAISLKTILTLVLCVLHFNGILIELPARIFDDLSLSTPLLFWLRAVAMVNRIPWNPAWCEQHLLIQEPSFHFGLAGGGIRVRARLNS